MGSENRTVRTAFFLMKVLLTIVSSFTGGSVAAQTEEPPKLVVDFRGPAGKTRALGFAGSHRRFFSAGENKRLQFYDLANDTIIPGSVIRWEFARGALGEVNDAETSADGTKVLIGGCSLRNAGGDLVLVDTGTQTVLAHFSAPAEVVCVALSASGQTVVAADLRSGITAWRLIDGVWQQRVLRPSLQQADAESLWNPAAVIDDATVMFLSADPDNPDFGRLATCDLVTGNITTATTPVPLPVCSLVSVNHTLQRTCVSASIDGTVLLHSSDSAEPARLLRISELLNGQLLEPSITTAALAPDATLLAIAGDGLTPDGDQQVTSFITLLDLPSLKLRDIVRFTGEGCCETLCFSPESTHLLACNDVAETALLWNLRDAGGEAAERPLTTAPLSVVGRGRAFQTARFVTGNSAAPDGYQLHLTDSQSHIWQLEPGPGELEQLPPSPAGTPTQPVNGPDTFAPGWSVAAEPISDDGRTQILRLVPPAGSRAEPSPVQLSVIDQGTFSGAFAFLQGTPERPQAVAIGTTLIDGIFVYRIPSDDQQPLQLVRYFRDHAGTIRDLSVSSDQRFLASAAADQTVKIWSLEGIEQEAQRSIFGGRIALQPDGTVKFSDLNPAGILYARGIRDGDAIAAVRTALQPDQLVQDPAETARLFSTHPAWATLDLWLARTGFDPNNQEVGARRINPGWEPLLTLVTDKTGEWVLFTPEGWFDASIASGDRLFGWQINRGVALPPRYEPAEHLQKEYEKPEVIRQVLQTGSVPEALAALNRPVVGDLQIELRNRVLSLPEIRILNPPDGLEAQAQLPIPVTAEVTFAQPQDANAFEIQAAQNGRHLIEQNRALQNGILTITWSSQTLEAANQFSVTAREIGNDLASSDQSKAAVTVLTGATTADPQARVFLLALAVDAYQKIQPLQFSVQSVTAFRNDLQTLTNSRKNSVTEARVLADKAVSMETVQLNLNAFLSERQKRASPDDLIIVVVSGQGVSRTVARGSSIRLNALEEFFFLPPQVDPGDLRQLGREGIRWKNLCDPINQSDCDVLWIVDASHSQRARNEAKAAFSECRGPHGRHVIFTDQTEAIESAGWQVQPGERGNSSLMTAVREALLGHSQTPEADKAVAALWQDQQLSFDDLSQWTANRAQRLAESVGKRQKVVYSPTAPGSATHPLILGTRTSPNP